MGLVVDPKESLTVGRIIQQRIEGSFHNPSLVVHDDRLAAIGIRIFRGPFRYGTHEIFVAATNGHRFKMLPKYPKIGQVLRGDPNLVREQDVQRVSAGQRPTKGYRLAFVVEPN